MKAPKLEDAPSHYTAEEAFAWLCGVEYGAARQRKAFQCLTCRWFPSCTHHKWPLPVEESSEADYVSCSFYKEKDVEPSTGHSG